MTQAGMIVLNHRELSKAGNLKHLISNLKKRAKPNVNREGISLKQLCVLLLLFRRPTIYKFDTETGFDNFLSQFKLTRQQLIQNLYTPLEIEATDT